MRQRTIAAGVIALLLGIAGHAQADALTFTGSGANNLSASATFTLTGSTLTISLTNTSSVVVPSNSALLTGVFWDSSVGVGGTFQSIGLGPGSVVDPYNGATGYFAYGTNTGGPGQFGAFSAGYASWDKMIAGPNGPTKAQSPDGPTGGLISQAGLVGSNVNVTVIKDTAVWTIGNVNSSFVLSDIKNVSFQYGTNLSETNLNGNPGPTPVPVPSAVWMGLGLLGCLGGVGTLKSVRGRRDVLVA
jgi:hypothetical protein